MFYENNHVKTCTGMGTQIFDKSNSNPHETVTSSDRNPLGTSKKKNEFLEQKSSCYCETRKKAVVKGLLGRSEYFLENLEFLENTVFQSSPLENLESSTFRSQCISKTWKSKLFPFWTRLCYTYYTRQYVICQSVFDV